jgi:hypothetical protein
MSRPETAQVTATVRAAGSPALPAIDRLRRYAGPTILLGGSALTVAGMALHVAGDGSPADETLVRTIEAHSTQWLVSHFLLAAGMALVAGGAVTALRLVRRRGATLTVSGVLAMALGAALMSWGDLAHGILAFALVGNVDPSRSLAIQEAYFLHPAVAAVSFGGMLLPLGVLLLGVALLRSHAVPRWAAIVLLVSPIAMTLGFASGPRMLVLGLPFVVGMAALSRAVARS